MPEPLSIVTEPLPKSQVGMTIEVPAEVVDATYDRVLNRLASRAKIEGFRPGKAPRALVEARIGSAVLREEVVETMVPEVVRQALDEKSIDPIDNPDVEVLELERGRPARLKATISVMPEVTLADVTKLNVEPPDHTHEVTDEMLERRLADLREPMAEITPVEREVRTGDIAVIDIEVEAGGQVVESETRKSTEAEVKEGVLLPELIAVLPGTFVGETREANVSFPESYSNPQLAGKDATIRVTVRGVKEKVLPPLDDELVKSLTSGKQETVEAYKQAVREELEESAHAVEKMDRESAVVKALVDASSVEVPEALVDRELTSELESLERSLNRQGMKLDRYFQYLGRSIDEWIAAQRPDAEARLKIDLVLAEYARREGLEPSEEDVAKFLEEQAGSDDELKGQVTELKRSPTATRYFASRLRRRRVLDQLLQVAGS
ncbi:MAG: trigger factor [Chloroflexi bacterium]|nr:MAG: trigger factor [Chloroflexota bacterium]TMF50579.1 MAG: trigger factor [Chloroflexota bacterium]